MPEMDGFEFCRRAKADTTLEHVPILVQTAIDSASQRNEVFQLGATDLITKPINTYELTARVCVHLENRMLLQDLRDYQSRMESELSQARQMQDMLMPAPEDIRQIEARYDIHIASYFETSSHLGGDCWGIIPISPQQLGVYITDFSGHGVSASLNTFRLHTMIRELKPLAGTPSAFLERINNLLYDVLPKGHFATMCYCLIDFEKFTITYSAAGAPHPILFNNISKTGRLLDGSGLPLGIMPGSLYDTRTEALKHGDVLMLYSDALLEAQGNGAVTLNERHILDSFSQCKSGDYLAATLALFNKHSASPLADDLTLNIYYLLPANTC